MKSLYKNIFWAVATLIIVALLFSVLLDTGKEPIQLTLNELVNKINNAEVSKIVVSGNDLDIELKSGEEAAARKESEAGLTETLRNYGVNLVALQEVKLEVKEESGFRFWAGILIPTLLPLLIIVGIFWFIFRQAKGGAAQAFTFGKANIRLFTPHKDRLTFKDVAGLKEAKQELIEIVDFLKNPKKYFEIGARIPRGVLLLGPPGTGKTLLAKATAGEANVPFFHISASEFVEMFVGVGASVSGDTPVLIKTTNGTELIPIKKFADKYYNSDGQEGLRAMDGVYALGYKPLKNKFWGTKSKDKSFFGGSSWSRVKAVYRHKVNKLYKISYRGGTIKTTGDHSIFVREGNMIKAKRAAELKHGDILVNLPFKTRSSFIPRIGTTHKIKAHDFGDQTTTYELDLYDKDYQEELRKYQFVMENRGVLTQAQIGATVGMAQGHVKDWQIGRSGPRLFNASVVRLETPRKLRVTPDLLKLLGYYTAEGNFDNYTTNWTFGLHETELHNECASLIESIFNIKPRLLPRPETSSLRVSVSSPIIGRFFKNQCGTGSHNKHVPGILWQLPKNYFLAYLEGYVNGDGYTAKDGKLSATSVSKKLIIELAWLCAMHGIQVGIRESVLPAGRIINKKPLPETRSWNLIIGKTAHPFRSGEFYKNQFKKPIVQKVEEESYDSFVYDLCGCDNEAFFGGEKPVLLHNSRTRDAFATAKKSAPSILFIDEIDAVGRERGAGLGGGHDEREQTLNQILVEMDGFDRDTRVVVLAATNRPDILDPALLRPGRFDRRVLLDMPDINDREEILKLHAKGKQLAREVDLRGVAVRTPGFSGADLANLMNEAAILAARHNQRFLTQQNLYEAIEKVILGPERRGRIISAREKKITAYHEAGHALVAASLKDADPVQKVSVVSRGRVGGFTLKLPLEEMRLRTRAQFMTDLATAMGGYASEKEVFGEMSTGASNDIKEASELARRLVTKYGMSEKLGPITFGKTEELIFLGREISAEKNYSEKVAAEIDEEVNKFISKAYEAAKKILKSHKRALDAIAKVLMEKETLEHEEFYNLLKPFKLKSIGV